MRFPIFPLVHWRKAWTGKAACDELSSGKVHEQVASPAPATSWVHRRQFGNYPETEDLRNVSAGAKIPIVPVEFSPPLNVLNRSPLHTEEVPRLVKGERRARTERTATAS